jgi:hypothetical protein
MLWVGMSVRQLPGPPGRRQAVNTPWEGGRAWGYTLFNPPKDDKSFGVPLGGAGMAFGDMQAAGLNWRPERTLYYGPLVQGFTFYDDIFGDTYTVLNRCDPTGIQTGPWFGNKPCRLEFHLPATPITLTDSMMSAGVDCSALSKYSTHKESTKFLGTCGGLSLDFSLFDSSNDNYLNLQRMKQVISYTSCDDGVGGAKSTGSYLWNAKKSDVAGPAGSGNLKYGSECPPRKITNDMQEKTLVYTIKIPTGAGPLSHDSSIAQAGVAMPKMYFAIGFIGMTPDYINMQHPLRDSPEDRIFVFREPILVQDCKKSTDEVSLTIGPNLGYIVAPRPIFGAKLPTIRFA